MNRETVRLSRRGFIRTSTALAAAAMVPAQPSEVEAAQRPQEDADDAGTLERAWRQNASPEPADPSERRHRGQHGSEGWRLRERRCPDRGKEDHGRVRRVEGTRASAGDRRRRTRSSFQDFVTPTVIRGRASLGGSFPNGAIASIHGRYASGIRALLPLPARHVCLRQSDHRARMHRCGHHLQSSTIPQLPLLRPFRRRDPGPVRFRHSRSPRFGAPEPPENGTDNDHIWLRIQKRFFTFDDQLVTLRMFSGPRSERTGRWRETRFEDHLRPPTVPECWSSSRTKSSLAPITPTTTATAGQEQGQSGVAFAPRLGGTVNVCPRSDPQYGLGEGGTGIPEGAR